MGKRKFKHPKTIREIIWLTFSEADARFLDLFRIGYALGFSSFVLFGGYALMVAGTPFDPVAFGTGLSAILFGGAVGVGFRGKLEDGTPPYEPEPPEEPSEPEDQSETPRE